MEWKPYEACCRSLAGEPDAAFCPECGNTLIRCMTCTGLISPTEACPVCVAPLLIAGSVSQTKAGDRVSVPLILRNGSSRALWVKSIVKRDGHVDEPVPLTWEQIEPRAERHFTLDTPPLADGGSYTFRVIIVLATRHKGIEETYAFDGGVSLSVSGRDTQTVQTTIHQTINVSGTGNYLEDALKTQSSANSSATDDSAQAGGVRLDRAEKYELEQGIRGYQKDRVRVPRNVTFTFSGFPASDSPANGSMLATSGGRLVCGRNSRRHPGMGADVMPSDLCLRAYVPQSGAVDEPATLAISRHHFDLVIVNDRLCLHARTTRGMELNGESVPAGTIVPITPHDRLIPIPGRQDKLALQVRFSATSGTVDSIDIHRTPALTR